MKKSLGIEEIEQLRNLNIELMEAVTHVAGCLLDYAEKNKIPLPDDSGLVNLLGHVKKVIHEINEDVDLPPNLQHRFRTPSDKTEPSAEPHKAHIELLTLQKLIECQRFDFLYLWRACLRIASLSLTGFLLNPSPAAIRCVELIHRKPIYCHSLFPCRPYVRLHT